MSNSSDNEVIILPEYDDCGDPNYNLPNAKKEDGLVAVCPQFADKVIPIIFLPGVMGSNLMDLYNRPVWRVDAGILGWFSKGEAERKALLDPSATKVDPRGEIYKFAPEEKKFGSRFKRGWGEVVNSSYGKSLAWLQEVLDDELEAFQNRISNIDKKTTRQKLESHDFKAELGNEPLTSDEIDKSYNYQYPIHVMGYNWLQSNADSAICLQHFITDTIKIYGERCALKKVILITHSMGGLVARHCSEILKNNDSILGIIHGVMPDTGSPTAYKRMKAGEMGLVGKIIGNNGAELTPVLAQSPGPLQLLPGMDYGFNWLKVKEGKTVFTRPISNPYTEIYLEKNKWWGLCESRFLSPENPDAENACWDKYAKIIDINVRPFIEDLSGNYHKNTYAFYGNSDLNLSYGTIFWQDKTAYSIGKTYMQDGLAFNNGYINDPYNLEIKDIRKVTFSTGSSRIDTSNTLFQLSPPQEPGDGTVPMQGGRIVSKNLKSLIGLPVDHEGAYKNGTACLFALYSIVKLVQQVDDEF